MKKCLIAGVGVLALGYYLPLFIAHDFNPKFLEIDSCLDFGGVWDTESETCIHLQGPLKNRGKS